MLIKTYKFRRRYNQDHKYVFTAGKISNLMNTVSFQCSISVLRTDNIWMWANEL